MPGVSTTTTGSATVAGALARFGAIVTLNEEARAAVPAFDLTPEEDEAVVQRINEAKPDFVWVGLGAPKQERWMAVHEDRVQALMVGVGAAFDYEAGNIRRAPMWMQRHNLEWLYRLMQDPKRLFKRYFVTNTKYLWWTWRQ